LPQPGSILKLVPTGERFELRIKGPHVLPAYLNDAALNRAAFDEEGFFRTGDATRWVDADKPVEGLEYAGRIAEDFKLQSGTWVQGSLVRRDLVAALQPYVMDAVICAPDRQWLGAMIWLNVADSGAVHAALAKKLHAFNEVRSGGGSVVARLLVLSEAPSAALGEITDKRSINQRRVLEQRGADVEKLYADPPAAEVIVARPD
jgi:feruloyl-CoA synthase